MKKTLLCLSTLILSASMLCACGNKNSGSHYNTDTTPTSTDTNTGTSSDTGTSTDTNTGTDTSTDTNTDTSTDSGEVHVHTGPFEGHCTTEGCEQNDYIEFLLNTDVRSMGSFTGGQKVHAYVDLSADKVYVVNYGGSPITYKVVNKEGTEVFTGYNGSFTVDATETYYIEFTFVASNGYARIDEQDHLHTGPFGGHCTVEGCELNDYIEFLLNTDVRSMGSFSGGQRVHAYVELNADKAYVLNYGGSPITYKVVDKEGTEVFTGYNGSFTVGATETYYIEFTFVASNGYARIDEQDHLHTGPFGGHCTVDGCELNDYINFSLDTDVRSMGSFTGGQVVVGYVNLTANTEYVVSYGGTPIPYYIVDADGNDVFNGYNGTFTASKTEKHYIKFTFVASNGYSKISEKSHEHTGPFEGHCTTDGCGQNDYIEFLLNTDVRSMGSFTGGQVVVGYVNLTANTEYVVSYGGTPIPYYIVDADGNDVFNGYKGTFTPSKTGKHYIKFTFVSSNGYSKITVA
ncbi:MAG: hypothetical protein MJ248_03235 [Bacilli bacterium]|nr:hypothetical protein [Bacilli bacterium]